MLARPIHTVPEKDLWYCVNRFTQYQREKTISTQYQRGQTYLHSTEEDRLYPHSTKENRTSGLAATNYKLREKTQVPREKNWPRITLTEHLPPQNYKLKLSADLV